MGYGVASAKFTGAIYISIAARVPKLFRDSSRPQKGGVWELHENLAPWQSRTGKNVLILFKWPNSNKRTIFFDALRVHIRSIFIQT